MDSISLRLILIAAIFFIPVLSVGNRFLSDRSANLPKLVYQVAAEHRQQPRNYSECIALHWKEGLRNEAATNITKEVILRGSQAFYRTTSSIIRGAYYRMSGEYDSTYICDDDYIKRVVPNYHPAEVIKEIYIHKYDVRPIHIDVWYTMIVAGDIVPVLESCSEFLYINPNHESFPRTTIVDQICKKCTLYQFAKVNGRTNKNILNNLLSQLGRIMGK